MGLSQAKLADLAGLSRASINKLETGKITDLSLTRAERLANMLGHGLGVTGGRQGSIAKGAHDPLETAARTASVSYGAPLPAEVLRAALLSGVISPSYIPQLRALLEEAPVGVLSDVAIKLEAENGSPRGATWRNMRQLAASLGCMRNIWTV